MQCNVLGIGAYGPGFSNWKTLKKLLDGASICSPGKRNADIPRPTILSPIVSRRAPGIVKLALEAATQAFDETTILPRDTACVFGSSMGDSELLDYMCRTVATMTPTLSPTKFHNSVHNAPTGYWTIATDCHHSANSIAAYEVTTSVALLEALVMCSVERRPVLMVLYDIALQVPLRDFIPISEPFAAAILIAPVSGSGAEKPKYYPTLTGETIARDAEWPRCKMLAECESLNSLYNTNPAGRVLVLLEKISHHDYESMCLPLSSGSSLLVSLN